VVVDGVGTDEGVDGGVDLGRRIILPSSHVGSERAMRAAFMDAMAITGRFKKPHLFITLTSNSNWAETNRELISNIS